MREVLSKKKREAVTRVWHVPLILGRQRQTDLHELVGSLVYTGRPWPPKRKGIRDNRTKKEKKTGIRLAKEPCIRTNYQTATKRRDGEKSVDRLR